MKKYSLNWRDVHNLALRAVANLPMTLFKRPTICVYGVPRGGVFASMALQHAARCNGQDIKIELVRLAEMADLIFDDLIDSGRTKERYSQGFPSKPFTALLDKKEDAYADTWIVFPWEEMEDQKGPQDSIVRLLQYIGEDPNREGLKETPARVVRAYDELFAGYKQDPVLLFKTFDEPHDEMVVLKDINFTSVCEHHMLPFRGKAHVGYIPCSKVIGLSKLARLVDCFSRRLQVQERLCRQVTEVIDLNLAPQGSACVIEAEHLCLSCRGANKQGATMVTSSLTGVFRDKPEARAEFFNIIGKR